jgi:4-amino-4-deoxychorismate lyase
MNAHPMWVNGQPSEEGWPFDRALHFGDGLFETLIVRAGRIRFRALHQARLAEGCARLGIAIDHDRVWRDVDAAATTAGLVKLIVSRGIATARGYAPSGSELARHLIFSYPHSPQHETVGFKVVTLQALLGENPLLAGIKHLNRLEQVMARLQMSGLSADEGLMASSSGPLISGTMSNVFVLHKGHLMTPRIDRCGVAGVLRAITLREAARMEWTVTQADLPLSILDDCEGLFVTNVRWGIQPATVLNGRSLDQNRQIDVLRTRVESLVE